MDLKSVACFIHINCKWGSLVHVLGYDSVDILLVVFIII